MDQQDASALAQGNHAQRHGQHAQAIRHYAALGVRVRGRGRFVGWLCQEASVLLTSHTFCRAPEILKGAGVSESAESQEKPSQGSSVGRRGSLR